MMPVMTSRTFNTPFEQYRIHDGKTCTLVRTIVESDDDHDEESLPMHVVRFDDGTEIEAWPEELGE